MLMEFVSTNAETKAVDGSSDEHLRRYARETKVHCQTQTISRHHSDTVAGLASDLSQFMFGKIARKGSCSFQFWFLEEVGVLCVDGLDDGGEFVVYGIWRQGVFELARRVCSRTVCG